MDISNYACVTAKSSVMFSPVALSCQHIVSDNPERNGVIGVDHELVCLILALPF